MEGFTRRATQKDSFHGFYFARLVFYKLAIFIDQIDDVKNVFGDTCSIDFGQVEEACNKAATASTTGNLCESS